MPPGQPLCGLLDDVTLSYKVYIFPTIRQTQSASLPMAGPDLSKTRMVYLGLRDRITSGAFGKEGGLPGEQTLAAEYGVSRVTLRRALAALAADGLIDRRRGAGTFLAESGAPKPVVSDLTDVLAHLVDMGRSTQVRLLDCTMVEPASAIARELKLPAGARTQLSRRMRLIDGEPFSYLVAHVPERLSNTYSVEELSREPLLSLLERASATVDRAVQEIGAELAAPEVAAILGVEPGSPLLAMTRVTFDVNGEGIEHLRALYRPDRYSIRMDLRRIHTGGKKRWMPEGKWQ